MATAMGGVTLVSMQNEELCVRRSLLPCGCEEVSLRFGPWAEVWRETSWQAAEAACQRVRAAFAHEPPGSWEEFEFLLRAVWLAGELGWA